MSKKILVVTSKVLGLGHFTAAQNLYNSIKKQEGFEVDFYDWAFLGGKVYEFMLQNTPELWNVVNTAMQNNLILGFTKVQDTINNITEITKESIKKRELWKKIKDNIIDSESFTQLNSVLEATELFGEKNPDWAAYEKVVLTLPGTQSLGYSNFFAEKTFVLVTDYGKVDKTWTLYKPNTFLVTNRATEEYLRTFDHLKHSKIVQTGIPVSQKTKILSDIDKIDLRRKLGIKSDKFFVLTGGGAGGKHMLAMFKHLVKYDLKNTTFLVVCGRNDDLFELLRVRLEKYPNPNIVLAGYIENQILLEFYRAADMVITKPGGITTTELTNLNTPIGIYYYHTPEQGNLDHIKHHHLGIVNLEMQSFLEELSCLDKEDYDYFSKKMKKVANYNSAQCIIDLL